MMTCIIVFLGVLFCAFTQFQAFQLNSFSGIKPTISKIKIQKSLMKSKLSLVQPDWASPRVSILTEIDDYPGSLHDILKYFWKYDINLTHIESRPSPKKDSNGFNIYIDFHGHIGERNTDALMNDLKSRCKNMLVLDEREVPWFPHHISELDKIATRVLDAGAELQADHPGFHDPEYRKRRAQQAEVADNYRYGDELPNVHYTPDEVKTWGIVYDKLKSLQSQFACPEYLKILPSLEKECGYSSNNVPQVNDISKFLKCKTGFQIRPVSGLLSSRDFLNGLAFRTFFSTQYIRHSSKPLYTPEPDICHELIG
jgi:phenylalanine-4-hydroxylase